MLSRLKFKIEPLVNEMLDQIPQDVLIYGKVLDPAMGGGQFVKEVERRKRAAGLTDEQIKATTFGIERNILCRNYAVNKNKLVGTYDVGNFLEMENEMKFDVIVGNPPYQSSENHGLKLWPAITMKALSLIMPGGHFSWVIPSGWLESNNAAMKKVRTGLTSYFNLVKVDRTTTNYFNVGIDILSLHAVNEQYEGKTVYHDSDISENVDLRNGITQSATDILINSVLSKVIKSADERIMFVDEPFNSSEVSATKTDDYIHPIIYSTANRGFTKIKLQNDGLLKLAVNISSSYFSEKTTDNNMPITTEAVGALMAFIPLSSVTEGILYKKYLCSKLMRFVANNYKKKNTGFTHAVRQSKLPKLDLTKSWTDLALYEYFELTAEEIDHIESTIK